MKRLILILALVAFAGSSYATTALDMDSQELGLKGLVDFDTANGTLVDLEVKYGYFWIDDLEFGALAGFRDDNMYQEWKIGGFSEFNFRLESPVVPYIGAALTFVDSEVTIGAEKLGTSAVAGDFSLGLKYFLVENVAIDTDFVMSIASDDVYPEKEAMSDTDMRWRIGLRFYF